MVAGELARLLDAVGHAAGGPVRVVLLALRQARNPDAAFLKLLRAFHDRLRQCDVALLLCCVQPDLRKALADTGLDAAGACHIFCDQEGHDADSRDAVRHAYQLLGPGPDGPPLHERAGTRPPSGCAL